MKQYENAGGSLFETQRHARRLAVETAPEGLATLRRETRRRGLPETPPIIRPLMHVCSLRRQALRMRLRIP